jgi:hypothetical protein
MPCKSKSGTCRRIVHGGGPCSIHRNFIPDQVVGLDEEEKETEKVILRFPGQRHFETTINVLQKGNIPYFKAFVADFLEDHGGFHEIDLTNLNLDGTYFDDVITYMETGTLPLETEDLDRLLGLRKLLHYFAAKLLNACRGYVLGGHRIMQHPSFSRIARGTMFAYDPREDTWDVMANMPYSSRGKFATARVGTDIYVMGGTMRASHDFSVVGTSVSKYDSLTDTWAEDEELPDMIEPRKNHCSAVIGKNIYVMGGDNSKTVEVYDTENKTWRLLSQRMPEILSDATACVFGTVVYLFGAKTKDEEETAAVYKFDTILHEWSVLPIQVNLGREPGLRVSESFQMGSATKIGASVYIVNKEGDMLLFDPVHESLSPLVSIGPRVGGYTFGMGGSIYDVDWADDHDEKEEGQMVAKGTIDGNEITWSRIKNVPSSGLAYFGLASIENRDVLDDRIIRLKDKLALEKSRTALKRRMREDGVLSESRARKT